MKFNYALAAGVLAITCAACGNAKKTEDAKEMNTEKENKVLVAYFSATGTTKAVAEQITKATGGDLYEIAPEPRYTDADLDWHDKNSRSSVEMQDSTCRPALGGEKIDVAPYDVVFIGYPIWWDLAPRQVNTFVETHDLKGKRLVPFATSGGSTITNSVADLKRLYPDLDWLQGKLLNSVDPVELCQWAENSVE